MSHSTSSDKDDLYLKLYLKYKKKYIDLKK
jgi:hypothetical protein